MKKIINILFWGVFSIVTLLGGLWYLYYSFSQSELIFGIVGLIGLVVGGSLAKETISWINKTE